MKFKLYLESGDSLNLNLLVLCITAVVIVALSIFGFVMLS